MPLALPQQFVRPCVTFLKRLTTVKPKEVKLTVGLDIGSTSIKVVVLGPRKGSGSRTVVAQNLVHFTEGQEDLGAAIKTALGMLQLPVRTVNVGVSGQWVIMRVVEMPHLKPSEVKQALPFEAQRFLPFNIQDVVLDGEVLGQADASKLWVLIVACKKELIERRLDSAKQAGVHVGVIDVDALALANAFLSTTNGHGADGTRAILNVGAQMTNLVIFKDKIAYQVRDIPWGSDKLSRKVAEQTGGEAAAINEQLTKGDVTPELATAIKTVTETLVTDVQLSFDYFENRFGQPPDEILVSGGLSQSAVFLDALKSYFTQPVTAWSPVTGLPGQFTVAYGLALRTV